jgi:predicted Zn finger-like uncharacterized protein
MSIKTTCPECQARFTLEDDLEGKKVRCQKCKAVFGPVSRRDEQPDEEITASPRAPTRSGSASASRKEGDSSIGRRREEVSREKDRSSSRRDEDEERSTTRKRDGDRMARRVKKNAGSGMPVGWLVGAALGVLLFVGAVVGGLMWIIHEQTGGSDAPPPPPPPMIGPMAGGPPVISFEGKDGDPHEVPAGPFPPAGFPPAQGAPSEEATIPVDNPVSDVTRDEKDLPAAKLAKIGSEAKTYVKSGTVYIRVTRDDGGGSGSGFFAAADAPNLVVTNAHVVGMLEPWKAAPKTIEVVVNSGQKGEKTYKGKLVALDRSSDLAVIDIGVKVGLPKPLKIRSSSSVQELDEVYVFGFPLGERLGKEITIRDTSVSSLRKKHGILDRIQTKGGMDPGNSGGPVVDTNGHVIGVAVAIIVGREIQFAVPSDRVLGLLQGRVPGIGIGQPVKRGDKITAPVRIEKIDPRGHITQVGVEAWTGNPPAGADHSRPAASSAPPQLQGDSPRTRTVRRIVPDKEGKLKLMERVDLRGNVELPQLPAGKVYWVQPFWVRATGETSWGTASVYKGGEPLTPKEVALHARYVESEARRRVLLSVNNRIYVEDNDTPERTINTLAGLSERVMSVSPSGPTLALFYQGAARSATKEKEDDPDTSLETIRPNLNIMKARVQLDPENKVTLNQFVLARSANEDSSMRNFHETVKSAMDPTYLPLPNRTVKPRENWKTKRLLAIGEAGTPFYRGVEFDLTCTYLGTRVRAGREEAVIGLSGHLGGTRASSHLHGQVIVDIVSGIVRAVELNASIDPGEGFMTLSGGELHRYKVRLATLIQLQRDL